MFSGSAESISSLATSLAWLQITLPIFFFVFLSAVNFGAMGVFMAHELLHTFYDYGVYGLWEVFSIVCSPCSLPEIAGGFPSRVLKQSPPGSAPYKRYRAKASLVNLKRINPRPCSLFRTMS